MAAVVLRPENPVFKGNFSEEIDGDKAVVPFILSLGCGFVVESLVLALVMLTPPEALIAKGVVFAIGVVVFTKCQMGVTVSVWHITL